MEAVFSESLSRARDSGRLHILWLWLTTFFDVLLSAGPERWNSIFGGPNPQRQTGKNKTMTGKLDSFLQDITYAGRMLAKSPTFTVIAAVTIGLGIGATTTIFSVTNTLLLRPLPGVVKPGELFTAHRVSEDESSFHSFGYSTFKALQEGGATVADLAAYTSFGGSVTSDGEPQVLFGLMVSPNYFNILGVQPAEGRLLIPDDDLPTGDPAVVVLGFGTWKAKFAGDPSIVGRTITLNGRSLTVVGVTEEGFSGHTTLGEMGAYVPLLSQMIFRDETVTESRESLSLETVGRKKPGATLEQVSAAMNQISDELGESGGRRSLAGIDIRQFSNVLALASGPISAFMGLLFAVAGLILMIASVNVANMLLSRASARSREIALRQALGAGRLRIIRQLLTESVALFLMGGTMGIVISFWATGLFEKISLPVELPFSFDFSPDYRVMLFTGLLALATGVVFGLAPALKVSNPNLAVALNSDTSGAGSSGSKLRGAFVVSQVAGTALLLVTAGLFLRSLEGAGSVEVGFDSRNVGVADYDTRLNNYTPSQVRVFFDELERSVAAIPSVVSVGAASILPLSTSNSQATISFPDLEQIPDVGLKRTEIAAVSRGYFEAMRIPVLDGRNFGPADVEGGQDVIIINEEMANQMWPGESPVGRHVGFGSRESPLDVEIVGVVRNGKYRSLGEEPRFMTYRSSAQVPVTQMAIVARTTGDGAEAAALIRGAAKSIDPDLPVAMTGSMKEINGIALIPNKIAATIAMLFGSLGLLLASVGLYGVLSYSVGQRTREMGVRMALGAERSDVRNLVVRGGLKLTVTGLVVGLALAFGVTRFMSSLLYGVSPMDPLTFAGITLILTLVAFVASYVPAKRATETDPMQALRNE